MERFISEYYTVTENGEVYSYRFSKKKLMKQQTNSSGYKQVTLKLDSGRRMFLVHRLVAKYFILNYSEQLSVHHIDYDLNNNCVNNLQMLSYADNLRDAAHKLKMSKKLTKEQVIEIKQCLFKGYKQAQLAREYNVSEATISYIKSGKFWVHV